MSNNDNNTNNKGAADYNSWRGSTSSFCTAEGAGPKLVRAISAPMYAGSGTMTSCLKDEWIVAVGISVGVMTSAI